MLTIIISRSSLKLGHVGSKTRSLGQQATQVSDLGPLWPSCLITDGEKIIVLYATFTYISSQCQKYLQILILWAEIGLLSILFNSITFRIVYRNSLYQLF